MNVLVFLFFLVIVGFMLIIMYVVFKWIKMISDFYIVDGSLIGW